MVLRNSPDGGDWTRKASSDFASSSPQCARVRSTYYVYYQAIRPRPGTLNPVDSRQPIRRAGLRCARQAERRCCRISSPCFRPEDAPPTVDIYRLTGAAGLYREIPNFARNFASSEIANAAPEKKWHLNFHSITYRRTEATALHICREYRILALSKSSPLPSKPGMQADMDDTSRIYCT